MAFFGRGRGGGGQGGSAEPAGLPRIPVGAFDAEVLEASRGGAPVVVDFVAPWCRPCRAMEPVLVELAARYGDRVSLVSLDIQDDPDIAARLRILSIPFLAAYADGAQVGTLHGAQPKRRLAEFLDDVLADSSPDERK